MGFLYNKIEEALKYTDLSNSRRIDFIDFIISPERDIALIKASVKVFDEIEKLVKSSPQEIIDLSRTVIYKNQNLTKLASFFFKQRTSDKQDEVGLSKKIEIISVFWEVSHLLKFPAYLLSQRRAKIEFLTAQKQILNHFKFLGLSKDDIDLIRKIRNAHYHPFTFRNGYLVNDKDEKVANFQTIEDVFEKIEQIISWWFITLCGIIFFNPHFSIYGFYAARDELGRNKELYKEYLSDFQKYIPDSYKPKEKKEKVVKEQEKPPLLAIWITKGWRFLKNPIATIQGYIFAKSIENALGKAFQANTSREDIVNLANRVRQKVYVFGMEMSSLSSSLENPNDVLRMKELGLGIQMKASIDFKLEDNLGKKMFEFVSIKFKEKEIELEQDYGEL